MRDRVETMVARRNTTHLRHVASTAVAKRGRGSNVVIARVIESDVDVADGMRALRRACPIMRKIHDLAGDPPLRRREPGFEGLLRIVTAQQLSVASANAIWAKFEKAVVPMDAAALLACTDDQLRAAGMSRPKIKTLRAISQAIVNDCARSRNRSPTSSAR